MRIHSPYARLLPPQMKIPAAKHESSAALVAILLLLSPLLAAAQPTPDTETVPYNPRFSPTLSIIIIVFVVAIFFMAFFSIYIRHRNDATSGSAVGTRAANGRSRRLQRGLERAVIDTFPTLEYSKVKGMKIGKGALECAVCLCEFEDDETLRLIPKCDHVFHPECIDEWLASKTTCPVCRANLVPEPGQATYQLPELGEVRHDGDDADLEQGQVAVEPPPQVVDLSKTTLNRNRTRGSRSNRARRLPRSHSTGHSLVQPGEDTERFTLRLPVQVRQQIVRRQLDRAMSMMVLPREGSSRRGYRTGGDVSNQSIRFTFSRRFDQLSRSVRSDRWGFITVPPFFTKSSSLRSPKVAADDDEGTSVKPEVSSTEPTVRPSV